MSSLLAERGPIHVHVGGTAIFDGDPPAFEELLGHIAERLELIPRFRRQVRYLPGKVLRAEWEDDPDFDLRRHVRHLALPAPGGDAQLRELVGQIMSEPLDQSRPLWQLHLIERGPAGGFAVVSKTHHALVDGVSAMDVGAVILDPDPSGTDLGLAGEPWSPRRRRTGEVVGDRIEDAGRRLFGLSRETARRAVDRTTPAAASQAALRTAQGFLDLARSSDPVRPTFLNAEIGRDRRVAFASTELAGLKRAAAEGGTGATVNDAVLAVSAGALRRLFLHRGEEIPDEFVALVPMSLRKPGEAGTLGNRITTLMVPLPLGEEDPDERLRTLHETTARLKGSEAAHAASMVIEASGWVPPTMSRVLGSVGGALGPVRDAMPQRLPWNLVISNVPGPAMPLYLLGSPLRSIHPFVALSPQRRALSIGVISLDGGLHFGLVGDRDRLADLDRLAELIGEELAALGVAS